MPTISMPAPVGGWNARDAIGTMPATDAVQLINLIPRGTYVETRPIVEQYNTNPTDIVYTLLNFPDTTVHMVAAYDGGLYKVTGTGAPAALDTGFTTDYWQHAYHSGNLILVNGEDTPQVYDGSAVADATITGDDLDSVAIDPTTLYGVHVFKGRAFYWAENGTFFWYAGAGGYQGELSPFDVSAQSTAGIFAMTNLTLDGGDGVDDLLAIIMKDGTVLMYQGDDPGDANAFILGGRFTIPAPISIRGVAQYQGTSLVMTEQGVVDLLASLRTASQPDPAAFSSKINPAWRNLIYEGWSSRYDGDGVTNYWYATFNPGDLSTAFFVRSEKLSFEAFFFPCDQVVVTAGTAGTSYTSVGFVRDSASGAWCQFQDVDAVSACVSNDGNLYFSRRHGLTGSPSYDISTLVPITGKDSDDWDTPWDIYCYAEQAPQQFNDPTSNKHLTAARAWTNFQYPKYIVIAGVSDDNSSNGRSFPIPNHYSNPTGHPVTEGPIINFPESCRPSGWKNVTANGTGVNISLSCVVRVQRMVWQRTDLLFNPASMF